MGRCPGAARLLCLRRDAGRVIHFVAGGGFSLSSWRGRAELPLHVASATLTDPFTSACPKFAPKLSRVGPGFGGTLGLCPADTELSRRWPLRWWWLRSWATAGAAWPGRDGSVVYLGVRKGELPYESGYLTTGLRVFEPGVAGSKRVLTDDPSDADPQISPNGQTIVFLTPGSQRPSLPPSGDGGGLSCHRYRRERTAAADRRWAGGESDVDPAFIRRAGASSSTGRAVPPARENLSVRLDGSGLRRLTNSPAREQGPTASPSGRPDRLHLRARGRERTDRRRLLDPARRLAPPTPHRQAQTGRRAVRSRLQPLGTSDRLHPRTLAPPPTSSRCAPTAAASAPSPTARPTAAARSPASSASPPRPTHPGAAP